MRMQMRTLKKEIPINIKGWNKTDIKVHITDTGVQDGIYYEGIYMVKVILTEIRHFECPNQKI